MKRLVVSAAAAGGVAFALRRLARKGREMRDRCRELMHDNCCAPSAGCRPR